MNTDQERIETMEAYHYGVSQAQGEPETTFSLFGYGDYCGSIIDKANQKDFSELLDSLEIDYSVKSDYYSYQAINLDVQPLTEDQWVQVKETLDALQQYSVLCDETWSELEQEMYFDQWDKYVTEDCLKAVYPDICLDEFDYTVDDLKQYLMEIHSQYDNGSSYPEYTSYYYNFDNLSRNITKPEKHKLARILAANKG